MRLISRRERCRLCNNPNVEKAVQLPETTIADYFSKSHSERVERYPIDLYYCPNCHHIQLLDIIDPSVLFHENFTYMPGNNPRLKQHFEEYVEFVLNYLGVNPTSCVDIGSNDGLFLSIVRDKVNAEVLGIDPAMAPAKTAQKRGIETLVEFMDENTVNAIIQKLGKVNWVSANNVFAHTDDLQRMTKNISLILNEKGVFTFEISYLLDIFVKGLVGTIFHEHLSYHSIHSLIPFLEEYGLSLVEAKRVDSQGGALIGIAQKKRSTERSESISNLLDLEIQVGLDSRKGIEDFRKRIKANKRKVQNIFETAKGKKVAAFGAARSSNFLMEFFELGNKIEFIVDDNDMKKGKFFPNYGIPVLSKTAIHEKNPDYVLILAWIHTAKLTEVVKKISPKTKVITLYPEINIV